MRFNDRGILQMDEKRMFWKKQYLITKILTDFAASERASKGRRFLKMVFWGNPVFSYSSNSETCMHI